ncbi:MAG: hypothetical protein KA112_05145 [Alphaproteobacteria bacterium]|nr:hypothetical protein [Alphaproteobacteria bacterium]MBP7729974.1 hypothetical protein [Alphaproteobacteria bacterium]
MSLTLDFIITEVVTAIMNFFFSLKDTMSTLPEKDRDLTSKLKLTLGCIHFWVQQDFLQHTFDMYGPDEERKSLFEAT